MENKVFVVKTFQDNEVPASFDGAKIYIVGQDIVIKAADGSTYEYPFAAQFLSMSKDVFHLKFSDGKNISSKDLINYIDKNEFDIDGSLNKNKGETDGKSKRNDSNEADAEGQGSEQNSDSSSASSEKVVTKIVKVQEVVVVNASNETESSSNKQDEAPVNDFIGMGDYSYQGVREKPMVISSSGLPPKIQKEQEIIPPNPDSVATSKDFTLSTLQAGNHVDNQQQTAQIGGSRTDSSYEAQYVKTSLDLSSTTSGWTVNGEMNGWNTAENSVTRIISVDNADVLTSVKFRSEMPEGYKIIQAGTPEGNALNLKPNEFAIVYPGKDNAFSLDIKFNSATGNAAGKKEGVLDFVVSENPDKIINDNGSVNLGYTPTPQDIKLGNGDDYLYAGSGDARYDGGAGHDTIDYSKSQGKINVDLTQNSLASDDTDAGTVTLSNGKTQTISNFETIVGSNHGDTFTLNDKGYTIKGGTGDNTYIMNGGNNTITGNSGHDTLDYSKAGTEQSYNTIAITGRDDLGIDGVSVDFSSGKTTHNGWQDSNNKSGQDNFSSIDEVVGSSKNDHIILGDTNVKVSEKSGDNYIVAGKGNYTIDGGAGNSILDYSKLDGQTSINLNSGVVIKGDKQDALTNIHHVIGSQGGSDFTGRGAGDNTLVGVSGINNFTVTNGNNQLYGGNYKNNYTLDTGVSTIHANGSINTATVNNSILNYYGTSGQQASDSINILEYTGGIVHYYAGEGKSINNITAKNGGSINLEARGTTTFVSERGGTNSVTLKQGTLDYTAKNGGANTIEAASDTHVTLHGSKASHDITLQDGATLDLDYATLQGGQTATIDLNTSRTVNIDNGTYVDLIKGDGLVNHLSGLKGGNTTIKLSETRQEDMQVNLFGENNRVEVAKGLTDIISDQVSASNIVDYTKVSQRLDIDLSRESNNVLRGNATSNGEKLVNINYIIGNDSHGNNYKATDKFAVTFETGKGSNNTIVDTMNSHTYITQGTDINLDLSALNNGVTLNYDGINGSIAKGSYTSNIKGLETAKANAITTIQGTDGDDNFIIDYSKNTDKLTEQKNLNIITGGGNNQVTLKNHGKFSVNDGVEQSSPNSQNTLNLDFANSGTGESDIINFDGSGSKGDVKLANITDGYNNIQGSANSSQDTHFNHINKINYTGDNNLLVDWKNNASSVNITVNNGDKNSWMHVRGGGNIIDGGYQFNADGTPVNADKIAFVSYEKYDNTVTDSQSNVLGLSYDANDASGEVKFASGARSDTVKNINVFQGSAGDDTISLKSGMTLLSSGGNDTLTGNNGTYQLASDVNVSVADFSAGSITKRNGNTVIGTDTLRGADDANSSFAEFTNSSNAEMTTITSSNVKDMKFSLIKGDVNFNSTGGVNNQIVTGAANLKLNYKNFTDNVAVNLSDNNLTVEKSGGKKDKFDGLSGITGSDHGDTYTLTEFNAAKELNISTGQGRDTFSFKNVNTSTDAKKITISSTANARNGEGDPSEVYNFSDVNKNISVTTNNANNIFTFDSAQLSAVSITANNSISTSFNFNNVTSDINNKTKIVLSSKSGVSENISNSVKFSGSNSNFDVQVSNGKNAIEFSKAAGTESVNDGIKVAADSLSNNNITLNDVTMNNSSITSASAKNNIELSGVQSDSSANKFKINLSGGNNATSGDDNQNVISLNGTNKNIAIDLGMRNDTVKIGTDGTNDNITVNSAGGNNSFTFNSKITNSQINLSGNNGENTFVFNNVNKDNEGDVTLDTGLNINTQSSGSNNTYRFEGDNSYIRLYSGTGDDTYYFNSSNNNIQITEKGGKNTYYISDSANFAPAKITGGVPNDGGTNVDTIIFKNLDSTEFNVFNYQKTQTQNIEEFKFVSAEDGSIKLDFNQFDNNSGDVMSNKTVDLYAGNKNAFSIENLDTNVWTKTTENDVDTYTHNFYGYKVNIHGDQAVDQL
ncbi:MAG: hypothetical protein XXXJIFNMEKO3_02313 [Candidatus Erwinia impunctatus]|nr:hypothetical protein XXXJIFNMEKO_02313 [Culicoides impunctatus]